MCSGSGKTRILVYKSGGPVYGTTAAKSAKAWEKYAQWEAENTESKEINCTTCKGTGKLPKYLTPGYFR